MAPIFVKRPEQFFKSTDSLGSVVLRDNSFWSRGNEENVSILSNLIVYLVKLGHVILYHKRNLVYTVVFPQFLIF